VKKILFIFAIATLLMWPACNKKPESSARVEVIDGIENVHNTKTPLYPNKTGILEQDLKIGGEDEDGDIILYKPGNFVVDEKENIYITDAGDQGRRLLYNCLNNQYTIDVYDKVGKLIRKIHRIYEPIPFTDEDAKEFYKNFENAPNPLFLKIAKKIDLPKIKTITTRMIVDSQGNFWMATYEKKKENEILYAAYDVFNRDGYYDSKIWLDRSPDLFAKGKVYRMETDEETGYRFLKRYRIIWSD